MRRCHMKKALGLVLFLVGVFPVSATTDDTLVKFKGGIGVIPVSSAAGVANADGTFPDVNRNTVRGVNPPGQIWTIADLRAEVNVDGRIKVRGRGLLLAGGNSIGTNADRKSTRLNSSHLVISYAVFCLKKKKKKMSDKKYKDKKVTQI